MLLRRNEHSIKAANHVNHLLSDLPPHSAKAFPTRPRVWCTCRQFARVIDLRKIRKADTVDIGRALIAASTTIPTAYSPNLVATYLQSCSQRGRTSRHLLQTPMTDGARVGEPRGGDLLSVYPLMILRSRKSRECSHRSFRCTA